MTETIWLFTLTVVMGIAAFGLRSLYAREKARLDHLEANAITGRSHKIQNDAIRESLASLSAKVSEGFAGASRDIKAVELEMRRLDERQQDRVSTVVRELHVKIEAREEALTERIEALRRGAG